MRSVLHCSLSFLVFARWKKEGNYSTYPFGILCAWQDQHFMVALLKMNVSFVTCSTSIIECTVYAHGIPLCCPTDLLTKQEMLDHGVEV